MSSKKDREQKLLLLLSKNQEYMTSEDLAETLHTSQKTIYRLIKKINTEFSGGTLILSEKGRGYKLDKEKFIGQNMLKQSKKSHYSPRERRNRIMEELLLFSPKAKNVYDLYEEYFVGESVIFNDEQAISEQLQKYNLQLVRKQRTVAIKGEEANIRKAITDLIQLANIIDIDEIRTNEDLNFNNYDVLFILEQLRSVEKQLEITIPYPYNINIFSHLYILISRSRKVGTDALSERNGMRLDELKQDEKDQQLYKIAAETIHKIENYLAKQLPESETYYLYQYLVSSRMQGSFSKLTTFSADVTQITQLYLDEMAIRLNVPMKNEAIFLDLANHIKPMLNRLRHGIQVKNSLLSQIKMTYESIFSQVAEVSAIISTTFALPVINEDENGFITLYFARIIETNQLPLRTIIMCTTGIGTSELLKVKVEKKFPELEIVDVLASRNAKTLAGNYAGIDLILSTVHLPASVRIPSLLVSAMFTADDQNRLQKKIEEIYHER
ncbi:PRD domain-containing protein [Erwinia sp. CPCC 100877]|nr:PRD domain-containing protein [Erwinia sp. CPCC 100877]